MQPNEDQKKQNVKDLSQFLAQVLPKYNSIRGQEGKDAGSSAKKPADASASSSAAKEAPKKQ